jgi:putative transposase
MSLWQLNYHFVWGTYQRLPLITPVREAALYRLIQARTHKLGGRLHAVGGIADHIHVIASVPPSIALSEYIQLIKGGSSRFLNLHYPNVNPKFKWQKEYGVFTISDRNLHYAVAYVQNQKHHHRHNTLYPQIEPDALYSSPSP